MPCYFLIWWPSRASRFPRIACNSTAASPSATPVAVVDYLRDLGISDCYASSYLKAVPGSPHGYDVADPTRLNPEIGTDEDYWAWIDALHARGMGHVMDLVPNHMGIAKSANPWWLDVLENGPSSRFARFFDIDWHPVKDELADKVLIPILGDQYGAVLERQELQLAYRDGAFMRPLLRRDRCRSRPTPSRMILERPTRAVARRPRAAADADELQSILTATPESAVAQRPRSRGDRDARAREGDREAAPGGARPQRSAAVGALIDDSVRAPERRRRRAAQLRSARPAAERAVLPARALARGVGGDQLPALLRRERARRAAHGRSGGVRRGPPLRVRAGAARRGHRAAHRSRRRPVRARRLPAAAAGAAAPMPASAPIRSSSSSRRSSAPASSCRATGRCTAPPATSSRAIVNNLFVDRRNERALRRSLPPHRPRARDAVVRRSRLPQQEAGAARDDVGRHQLARPSAQSVLRAQPPLPRLHALQPDLDAEGGDRLLPGLPDLHHRRTSRSATTIAATSSRPSGRRGGARRRSAG